MKKLSEVTEDHAKEIIKFAYPHFFYTGTWKLYDESKDIDEPCKKLKCELKAYWFWFFDDCIDIDMIDESIGVFDSVNFDVKLKCYVKAHELGYFIKEFTNFK